MRHNYCYFVRFFILVFFFLYKETHSCLGKAKSCVFEFGHHKISGRSPPVCLRLDHASLSCPEALQQHNKATLEKCLHKSHLMRRLPCTPLGLCCPETKKRNNLTTLNRAATAEPLIGNNNVSWEELSMTLLAILQTVNGIQLSPSGYVLPSPPHNVNAVDPWNTMATWFHWLVVRCFLVIHRVFWGYCWFSFKPVDDTVLCPGFLESIFFWPWFSRAYLFKLWFSRECPL